MFRNRPVRVVAPLVALIVGLTGLQLTSFVTSSSGAATTVRINAGGPAVTQAGTTWAACSAINACNGYVTGGFPWKQSPAPAVSGYPANTTAAMHQKEWTGGSTNGVAYGAKAFSFNIPVAANNTYDVTLQFTELNKNSVGARVFDVNIDGTPQLTYFDVFAQAGGLGKTITRTFRINDTNGVVNIDFIRRTENAKVDAIEIVPATTTTTTTAPTTTSTSSAPTTTTQAPTTGTNISWTRLPNSPYRSVEGAGGIIGNKLYQFGGYRPETGFYKPADTATAFDFTTNKWSFVTPIPYGLNHSARVIDGGRFILAGGVVLSESGGQIYGTSKVLTYEAATDKWGYLPDLPAPRGSGAAALVGRDLHYFGGVDVNLVEKTDHWVLNLDNLAAGWQATTPFPSSRSHFAAVVASGNSIYAFGGQNKWEQAAVALRTVYKFDVTSGGWTRMADMPVVRSHVSEASMDINGRIWMFGGEETYPKAVNDIYVYDVAANKWSKANAKLPGYRFAGIGDHVGNTVYYVGGTVYEDGFWRGVIR